MDSMTRCLLIAALVSQSVWVTTGAAEDGRLLSVSGVGRVTSMPDVVEIVGVVSGKGELAGDALTNFYAVSKEASDTLEDLGIEGLSVSTSGLSVGTLSTGSSTAERLLAARGQSPPPKEISFTEQWILRVEGVDDIDRDELLATIVKVVDAGNEAGLKFGKPKSELDRLRSDSAHGYLLFRLENSLSLRQKAREIAVQDARVNAEELSKLAGVSLGRVYSIDEVNTSSYVPSSMRTEPGTSPTLKQIEVTTTVRVKFELAADSE